MPRYLGTAAASFLAVMIVVLSLATGAFGGDPSPTTTNGAVLMRCDHSNFAQVDPILSFGQAQSAHQHEFFGNTGVTASSTLASLRTGATTCAIKSNLTAYWKPALLRPDGTPSPTTGNAIYYRCNRPHGCETFPQGFRWISGNPRNTSQYAATGRYQCGGSTAIWRSIPTSCPPGKGFQLTESLSSCWDGKTFNTPNDTPTAPSSNMAYVVDAAGNCPASHPVPLPQLTFVTNYGPDAVGGRFSSDLPTAAAGASLHSDVFIAWDSAALQRIIDKCLNVADDTPSSQSCRVDLTTGSVLTNPGGEFVTN